MKEALWLRGMISYFGINQDSVVILCNIESAIHLSKHQLYHERTKHIDVRLYFVRDVIEDGIVEVNKVHTDDNASDC